MLYILNISYEPNTASTNRLLGYYSALDKTEGIDTTIVYLLPNSRKTNLENIYERIRVINPCFWGRATSKLLRFLFFHINLCKFILNLRSGDVVYTYSINKATRWVTKLRNIRVFAERTEHPGVVAYTGAITGLKESEELLVARKLDGLFVISEPLREFYISKGVAPQNIRILNMTVDMKRFEGINKTPSRNRYIAYCGTASNNKDGVDKLLRSFSIVSKQMPDIYLYIIGKTPSRQNESDNLKLIEELGVADKVIFTGLVNSEDMPQILKDAEVLALARPDNIQAKYGFPTKLGEYLLTGNPVVITSVGDIPKFLKDGESALLSSPTDNGEFADKLFWLLNNPREAEKIGKKGTDIAKKHFNAVIETKKMVDFIK